jgi:hypothetical protein
MLYLISYFIVTSAIMWLLHLLNVKDFLPVMLTVIYKQEQTTIDKTSLFPSHTHNTCQHVQVLPRSCTGRFSASPTLVSYHITPNIDGTGRIGDAEHVTYVRSWPKHSRQLNFAEHVTCVCSLPQRS